MSDTPETPDPAFPDPDLEVEAGVADPGPATEAGDTPDEGEAPEEAPAEEAPDDTEAG